MVKVTKMLPAISFNEAGRLDLVSTAHTERLVYSRLALLAGLASFVVILFWTSYASIADLWDTSDHRHGILVFPIAAFLIWRLRQEIAALPMVADYRGLVLIIPLASAWLLARLAGIQIIEHFAVLVMVPAVVLTLLGKKIAVKLMFPLLFLIFATPLSDALIPYMMIITADVSTALLKLSAFPVFREGQYISLPGGEFVVADVCSGVRYLVTGVMVAALYGYLTYESLFKRMVLVVVTAVALIVANGARAYIVMAVASATNMQYLGGRDHIYFGWLLFGIVMMLIMWLGTRYADYDDTSTEDKDRQAISGLANSAVPLISALALIMLAVTIKPLQADFGATGALLVVALALLVFIYFVARRTHHIDTHSSENGVPRVKHNWKEGVTVIITLFVLISTPRFVAAVEANAAESVAGVELGTLITCPPEGVWGAFWRPKFENADAVFGGAFNCRGATVNAFSASYSSALQGKELISSSNAPFPRNWDRISRADKYELEDVEGAGKVVNEIHVDSTNYRALIWYWYEVDGRQASSSVGTKMLQILALLKQQPAGGRIVILETTVTTDIDVARARLDLVVNDIGSGTHQ